MTITYDHEARRRSYELLAALRARAWRAADAGRHCAELPCTTDCAVAARESRTPSTRLDPEVAVADGALDGDRGARRPLTWQCRSAGAALRPPLRRTTFFSPGQNADPEPAAAHRSRPTQRSRVGATVGVPHDAVGG